MSAATLSFQETVKIEGWFGLEAKALQYLNQPRESFIPTSMPIALSRETRIGLEDVATPPDRVCSRLV